MRWRVTALRKRLTRLMTDPAVLGPVSVVLETYQVFRRN